MKTKLSLLLRTALAVFCLGIVSKAPAEAPLQRFFPFEVERLECWAPEYLTVIRTFKITNKGAFPLKLTAQYDFRDGETVWFEQLSPEKEGALYIGTVITAVDGRTTQGMTKTEFYACLSESGEHELDCISKGYVDPYKVCIRIKDNPRWMEDLAHITQETMLEKCWTDTSAVEDLEKKLTENRKKGMGEISRYWDPDFDWFGIRTYDFALTGSDPLVDKEIMEQFAKGFHPWLERDTDNPDVLIMLSKNKNESIQSTYVPPTTTVVSDGHTTRRVYNWTRTDYRYETQEHSHVERDGGYTQTTVSTDLFLEICMLDAKRLRDTAQRVPPIIYQLRFDRHLTDRQFSVLDEYKAVATWVNHPCESIVEQSYSFKVNNYKYMFLKGKKNTRMITSVEPLFMAASAGYRKGDIIQWRKGKGYFLIERDRKKVNIPIPDVPADVDVQFSWYSFHKMGER